MEHSEVDQAITQVKGIFPITKKIYVDMDGVLVDFMKPVRAVNPAIREWADDDILWPIVKAIPNFWEELEWMPGGKKLWEYVLPHNPSILSAPSRNDVRSPSGKLAWIHRHLGWDTNYHFTRSSRKCELARPYAILIDDLAGNVRQWNQAGGIGILHKSVDETLSILRSLGV